MSDSNQCPRCRSELPANFPPGVCPACLMQQGLSPSTFFGAGSSSSNSNSGRRRSWTPPTPAELAPRFPQLEIVELLGHGGMGAVYKVRQRDLDRWAALKVLPDDVAHDPNFGERFQREARALALLGHQHIVIVYEFGQRDGVYFLLMEFIDGVTLRRAIRAGQIAAKDALGIVMQICDALQFAHEEGVVHRDIKPENILIDKRGRVKIADFGLAKLLGGSIESPTLTGTHQVMGTPMYMAPEQMEGTRGVDHRADIFSLGVVFYELLTGELPLGRFAPPSQKYQLDVRLDDVVLRTLEKEPDRRYQQASDVKCDVESIRSQPAIAPLRTLEKPRRRIVRKLLFAAAMGFLGITAVLFLATSFARLRNERSHLEAQLQQVRTQLLRISQAQSEAEFVARNQRHAGQPPYVPLSISNPDSNEADAIVQFTPDGPRLHPDFGNTVLTTEHRQIVNRILGVVRREYLAVESRSSEWTATGAGKQVTVIPLFDDEITRLENLLWTEVDSQLPVDQQRFLREYLPLFADMQVELPLVTNARNMGMGGMSSMMGGGAAYAAPMAASGGSMMGMMPGGGDVRPDGTVIGGHNMRYAQLLGWKRHETPIRVTIGRRGKWYKWLIEFGTKMVNSNAGAFAPASAYAPSTPIPDFLIVDSGEAPELPSGIRHLWREANSDEQKLSTFESAALTPRTEEDFTPSTFNPLSAPRDEQNPFDRPPEGNVETVPIDEVMLEEQLITPNEKPAEATRTNALEFNDNSPMLNPSFGEGLFSDADRAILNPILKETHDDYLNLENHHFKWEVKKDGSQSISIENFNDEVSLLEDKMWTAIDSHVSVEQQAFLRKYLPIFADRRDPLPTAEMIARQSPGHVARQENLREQQLLGWSPKLLPIRIEIARKGRWYRWKIETFVSTLTNRGQVTYVYGFGDSGEDSVLPSGLRRFWRENVSNNAAAATPLSPELPVDGDTTENKRDDNLDVDTSIQKKSLEEELQELDDLRAGDKTPWDEIERRTNELLARSVRPEHKKNEAMGRIYWQAAHVYGQSDIKGHGADVTRHALEGLKYERDPIQRGWLYMYLGNAAEVRDDRPETFEDRRAEATRCYLRGYDELLPFQLPDIAPELPAVEKMHVNPGAIDGEPTSAQTAAEVRHAAQIKARQEAAFTRELVSRRDSYISRLRELFLGMPAINEKDAIVQLKAIAPNIWRDPEEVDKLINLLRSETIAR